MTAKSTVLRVSGLTVEAASSAGRITTVRDVDVHLRRGRICGVVGESGSGKSTTALAALGWSTSAQRRVAGRSELDGEDLFGLDPKRLRRVWGGRIGYVPQEIGGSLHPTYRVRTLFRETLRVNGGLSRRSADARAVELLAAAGIADPANALTRYPHEFSGGQLQRIAIALALAPRPDVLILDEPTTGLDVTTQKVVVGILRALVDAERVAALFISHDVALLAGLADDLMVMYAGEVVESGPAALVLHSPKHPYTRALLDAMPSAATSVIPQGIPGLAPGSTVDGQCAFADRCRFVIDRCRAASPMLQRIGNDRSVRCLRSSELVLRTAVTTARAGSATHAGPALLEVHGLTHTYRSRRGRVVGLADVSLTVPAGRVAGLVGESGSGKSTVARIVAGVLPVQHGTLRLDGEELPPVPARRSRQQRRAIQLIFQDAGRSLNPRRTVGAHLARIADRFVVGDGEQRRAVIDETLRAVQLSAELMDRYPAQLSGGQRQRVAIAAAFIARPRLVICDEITSGQDVSMQAAILRTLSQLQRRFATAVLFISHDLGVIRSVADHVYVMRHGRVVEEGLPERLFEQPSHPYTRVLLDAVPVVPPSPGGTRPQVAKR